MIDELSEIVNLETSEEDIGNNLNNFSVIINSHKIYSTYINKTQ